ncbi:YraN family protein [Bifidobacterium pongonis]|uniref:YraN family protein n=1 Tax=Bifidobacterium pongonis TaxID=2834432 RepID=UPI001F15F082|nr:YraN family protein [Bifidobacterium pongonis]
MESIAARLCGTEVSSRQVGALGESYTAAWLERRGWRILDRNWHCRYGELDIVALSTSGQIVFVEVKTRRGNRFGTPQEAVTPAKQANLRRAALQWLEAAGPRLRRRGGMRFDVVTVTVHGGQVAVHCIPGAF